MNDEELAMEMTSPFPAGLPFDSALYLTLLVATLVLHVVWMNYVLAGSVILAVGLCRPDTSVWRRLAELLREWLPSALGLAITAGIAPLLFVQICYQEAFFTANLLGFHRWMAVLPVLIVAFYLLYAIKMAARKRPKLAPWCAVGASLCFVFVALSWSENTVLAAAGREAWRTVYAEDRWFYRSALTGPRLALWVIGSVPTCAALLLLQCRRGATPNDQHLRRALARLALAAMAVATALGLVNAGVADATTRSNVVGPNLVWVVGLGGCWLATAGLWLRVARSGSAGAPGWLLATTVGSIAGATVLREVGRLSGVDLPALQPLHARAASKDGLLVFLLFAAMNSALIAWVVVTVRRAVQRSLSSGS